MRPVGPGQKIGDIAAQEQARFRSPEVPVSPSNVASAIEFPKSVEIPAQRGGRLDGQKGVMTWPATNANATTRTSEAGRWGLA